MVRACNFPGCPNKTTSGAKQFFHRFPNTNRASRELWLAAVGLNVHTNLRKIKEFRICSDHFDEADYVPSTTGKKHVLKCSAVPHVGPNTRPHIASSSTTPQVRDGQTSTLYDTSCNNNTLD